MFRWLRKGRVEPLSEADWQQTLAQVRIIGARPDAELERLKSLTEQVLARKRFSATHELELTPAMQRAIAVQIALPVLGLGFTWLSGWREVIVYPGAFRVRRREQDEATQVMHEWDDELIGEAWSHGPVVLSWADIAQDLEDPHAGFNVILHEVAHKLDARDGSLDGAPWLPDANRRRRWARVMQRAFDAHVAAVEAEQETVLDPYAAEAEDEFFAVLTEYYFSAPGALAEHYPDVYTELAAFYGPVPEAAPA